MTAVLLLSGNMAQARSIVIESEVFARAEQAAEQSQGEADAHPLVIATDLVLKPSSASEAHDPAAWAGAVSRDPQARVLSHEEILRVNESLRRAIEQSRRLKEAKRRADEELSALRQEKDQAQARLGLMENRVREYQQRLEQSEQVKVEYDRTVADLQEKFEGRVQNLLAHIENMQREIEERSVLAAGQEAPDADAAASAPVPVSVTGAEGPQERPGEMELPFDRMARPPLPEDAFPAGMDVTAAEPVRPAFSILEAQKKGLDVMDLLDYLDEARKQMRGDEAEIFYNMGRLYFYQGKYAAAAAHYRRALELAPAVANAHFNLAYISGEFLKDYETALEHYHRYLHLSPGADDEPLVREKILELRLFLGTGLSAAREQELRQDKRTRGYNW